jgi:hypothetical protein
MWDRGKHSYGMVEATASKGCEYLGRIPSNVKFLNETQLDDGSYLSWIYPSGKLRKKGFKPIQVRVIEYTIENYDRPEAQIRYCLITRLLNAENFPSHLLACKYHQRWEVENTIDEIKVNLLGRKTHIRSQRPKEVVQEIYGLLLGHWAIRSLIFKQQAAQVFHHCVFLLLEHYELFVALSLNFSGYNHRNFPFFELVNLGYPRSNYTGKSERGTTQELSKNLFQNFDLNKLNTEVLES